MKKVFALFIGLLFIASCEQDTLVPEIEETNVDQTTFAKKGAKVDVCHKGKIINVSVNSLSAHQGHGDAVDMDGDGYFDIENPCGPVLNEGEVLSANHRIWMDRNLGATQVATSSTDAASYGDRYQWGRATIEFTPITDSSYDWSIPQNDNLWKEDGTGVNNPCPVGFRLPTEDEWTTERESWSSNNAAGALASPLKLPMAGRRYGYAGSVDAIGADGNDWSRTVSGTYSRDLSFISSYANVSPTAVLTGPPGVVLRIDTLTCLPER